MRQKYIPEEPRYYPEERRSDSRHKEQPRFLEEMKQRQKYAPDDPRFYADKPRSQTLEKHQNVEPKPRQKYHKEVEYYEQPRKNPDLRQRSPSPEDVTPRDRFKDAKEKFQLLEKERLEQERKLRADGSLHKEKAYVKRHDSVAYANMKEKYDR